MRMQTGRNQSVQAIESLSRKYNENIFVRSKKYPYVKSLWMYEVVNKEGTDQLARAYHSQKIVELTSTYQSRFAGNQIKCCLYILLSSLALLA